MLGTPSQIQFRSLKQGSRLAAIKTIQNKERMSPNLLHTKVVSLSIYVVLNKS